MLKLPTAWESETSLPLCGAYSLSQVQIAAKYEAVPPVSFLLPLSASPSLYQFCPRYKTCSVAVLYESGLFSTNISSCRSVIVTNKAYANLIFQHLKKTQTEGSAKNVKALK